MKDFLQVTPFGGSRVQSSRCVVQPAVVFAQQLLVWCSLTCSESSYDFPSDFMVMWERYAFSKNCTSNFAFGSFPELALGKGSELWLPVSHAVTRANNPSAGKRSLLRWPFCFLVQHSINYTRYSTLYYKISFVSDDFAQLSANVSDWARLR